MKERGFLFQFSFSQIYCSDIWPRFEVRKWKENSAPMMCGFMSNLGEAEECNDVFAPICPVITARIDK